MNFDDQPVGQHNDMGVSEQPTTEADVPNETSPLSVRIASKNLKVRLDAMTELLNLFSSQADAELLAEHYPKFPKYLADKNTGVQEKAVDCFLTYFSKCEPVIDKTLTDCFGILLDKCLTCSKPQIKTKAIEVFLVLVEFENTHVAVKESIKEYLNLKAAPKTCSGAIQILTQLTSNFGISYFPMKDSLSDVVALCESTNAQVRTEAMNYLKEAYKWDKESVTKIIEKLRPAQQESLKKDFAELNEPGKPSRFVKGKENVVVEEKKGDDYANVAEASVLKKFNDHWCNEIMSAKKWSEKRDKLEELLKAISVEKIKSENISELLKTLKLLLQDANIVVSNLVLKIMGQLAKSLRASFSGYAKLYFEFIIQRLKDKKSVGEAQKCMENLLFSLKLEDMIDPIKEAFNDKSPQVKSCLCIWVEASVMPKASPSLAKTLGKELGPILIKLVDDGNTELRKNSLNCVASLIDTDPSVQKLVDELPSVKQKRIKEILLARTGHGSDATTEKIESCNSIANNDESENKENVIKTTEMQEVAHNLRSSQKGEMTTRSVLMKSTGKLKKEVKTQEPTFMQEELITVISQEEAKKLVSETITPEILAQLNSNVQEGLINLNEWLKNNKEKAQEISEAFIVWIKQELKDAEVLKTGLPLLKVFADTCILNRKIAHEIIPFLIEVGNSSEVIMSIADSVLPSYVVTQVLRTAFTSKDNTVIEAAIALLSQMLSEFGAHLIPLKMTIEFIKHYLSSESSRIKTAAVQYVCDIYGIIGNVVHCWLGEDMKEAMKKMLEGEFAKVKIQMISEVKRVLRGESADFAAKTCGKDLINTLVPRIDISQLITPKLLEELSDTVTSTRQRAKDSIERILTTANNSILPNGMNDLVFALIERMNDPCKNLIKGFITLVGNLALAMGSGFKQYSKPVIQALMLNLAGKQSNIRGEVLAAMDKIASVAGAELILNSSASLLEKNNPVTRTALLTWILKSKADLGKSEVQAFVKPLILAMQDKSKKIRELAIEVVKEIISYTGHSVFIGAIQDLKPAVKSNLENILNKCNLSTKTCANEDKDKEETANESCSKSPSVTEVSMTKPDKLEQTQRNHTSNRKSACRESKLDQVITKEDLKSSAVPGKASPRDSSITRYRTSLEKKTGDMMGSKSTNDLVKRFGTKHAKEVKKISRKIDRPKGRVTSQSPSQNHIDNSSNGSVLDTVVISTLGNKEKREEADKLLKWSINEVNEDHLIKLKKTLKNLIHPYMFDCMFSSQFKNNVKAINALTEGIKGEFLSIIDLFDLFCKWLVVKMIDQSNTTIIKSALEFLLTTFRKMKETDYHLFDFEAAAILPMLCEKLGTNFRQSIKDVFKLVCHIYSPLKIANFITSAIETTKNQKTKSGCLELLKELGQEHDINKICSAKCVKAIAKLIGTTDKSLKEESMTLLEEIYKSRGESIWSVLSDLPERSKEMLQKKFNTTILVESEESFSNSINTSEMHETKRSTTKKNSNSILNNSHSKATFYKQPETRRDKQEDSENTTRFNATNKIASNGKIKDMNKGIELSSKEHISLSKCELETLSQILNVLKGGEISKCVDALMRLNEIAMSITASDKESLVDNADLLFTTFSEVLNGIFEKSVQEIPIRFAKYFMTVISKICANKSIVKKVCMEVLLQFAEQLLTKLLYDGLEKLGENNEGEYLIKTFNSTMLKVLENCNPTISFTVLITLFKKYKTAPSMMNRIKSGKLPGLIVKCILKLIKVIDSLAKYLDISSLLICMHENLLVDTTKTANDDIGIRIAKTLVNELVRIKGEAIMAIYSEAETSMKNDIYINKWIEMILKHSVTKSVETLSQPEELREIFKQLCSQETFKEGIKTLGHYVIKYPDADLSPYFVSCSAHFKDYVMGSLQKFIEKIKNPEEEELKVQLKNDSKQAESSLIEYKNKLALLKQKFDIGNKDDCTTPRGVLKTSNK